MLRTTIVIAAALAFAAGLPIAPAQAVGAARTFVSAAGSDSNNCTNVVSPCRHLAAAYAATAPNGEIYVLDPANYGSLTITGPVSIEGHGWASIAPVAGQAAITINAAGATDKINIIGVVLDGTAIANAIGIRFNSGGTLTVRDSVIRNFTVNGIVFQPNTSNPSQFSITNSNVSDNSQYGVLVLPNGVSVGGVLDHVGLYNNGVGGLLVNGIFVGASNAVSVTAIDSVASNNGITGTDQGGFAALSALNQGGANLMLVRSAAVTNSTHGILASGPNAAVIVNASTVFKNSSGWVAESGGKIFSYENNTVIGNDADESDQTSALTAKK